MGTAATELRNLNALGSLDPRVAEAKWQHSTAKGKVGMVSMDNTVKAEIRIV